MLRKSKSAQPELSEALVRADFVHRRKNTVNLYYERPVPPDLRDHPESKWHRVQWAVRCSLKTAEIRKANEAARRLSVEWDERFQAERDRLNPTTLELVTPEMAGILAKRVRSNLLTADDQMRFDPKKLRDLLEAFEHIAPPLHLRFFSDAAYTPPYLRDDPEWPASRGMRPEQLQRLADIHKLIGQWASGQMASGNLSLGRSNADDEARKLGFRVNWDKPENFPALLTVLRAVVSAWIDRGRRDAGEVIETPVAPEFTAIPAQPRPATGHFIADALGLWEKERERSEKTLGVFRRHAAQFAEFMGNPSLESLTLPDGLRFKDKVQEWAIKEKKTVDTANNVLSSVRAMLRLALQRGWLSVDPLASVSVKRGGVEGEDRQPWTVADLKVLFNAPLFTAYELPSTKAAGLDAAYWVPLMLAYSGARPGEIAQLWTDDIFETPGGVAIEFRENAQRGQRLKKKPGAKTSPSWRVTPVHERLIELGFADYWRAVNRHGVGPLFPAMRGGGQNGASAGVGKWFSAFKRQQGFGEKRQDLHSFRHTVRTELGFAGVSSDLSKAIIGHAGDDVHSVNYGATMRRRADDLRAAINKLNYPGLELPRVFTVPAWSPEAAK